MNAYLFLTVGVLYFSATSATALKKPAYKPNSTPPFLQQSAAQLQQRHSCTTEKEKGFSQRTSRFKALPQLPQKISSTVHYLFRLKFIERHIAAVLSGVAHGDRVAALRGFYQTVLGKCFQQCLACQAEIFALLIAEYFHMTISDILVEIEIVLVLESDKVSRIRVFTN